MATQSTPPRYALRQMLRAVLPTDSDFGALCLDYFPEVAERFSNSMDRVAKANLLLELSDAEAIVEALKAYDPQRLARYERLRNISDRERKNPYRGLSAFQQEDAHLFFGREALICHLWQQLEALYEKSATTRLLAILGPSGSGKSSVARAGLLAALMETPIPGPRPNCLAIVRPGERPIESLARALMPLLPQDSAVLPASRQVAVEKLLRDKEIPAQGLRRFAADLPGIATAPLVLLVDQFEEIYTLCKDPAERDCFVKTLLHAASDSSRQVSIVLTLRSDFLGETQHHHNYLNRLIASQGVIVPALSPDELRDAIVKPSEQAGRPIDSATVEFLLTETRDNQGALPLLEFALTRIWEGQERGEEPGATLRKLGGVGGALAGEAQKIYKGLSEPEQATARRALVRLVRLGEGTRDTRRRASLSELCGRGETEEMLLSVLRKFAAENARLLTLGSEGTETLVEVTHEALFEHWAEFRLWIEQGRKDRGLQDRVLAAAKLWTEAGRPAGRLWRSPDLDLLVDYQYRRPEEFGDLATEFLSAAQYRHRQERVLRIGTVVAVVAALSIASGVYVAKERERKLALREQLLESYIDRGRQLLFDNGNPNEGLLWLHRAQGEGSKDVALPDLLRSAMQHVDASKAVLIGHRNCINSAMCPDGRRLLTANDDGTARVWEVGIGKSLAEFKEQLDHISTATFSPDGRYVVTASDDGTARIWQVDTGQPLAKFKWNWNRISSVTFSPDGRYIVTASDGWTPRVWNAASGHLLGRLEGSKGEVTAVAFSPDGQRIVTGSADKMARVWATENSDLLAELNGHEGSVNSVAFSPDGQRIVTGSADNTARVWAADWGNLLTVFRGHEDNVNSVAFSPDGQRILTASSDRAARIWQVTDGKLITEIRGHESAVLTAKFSLDGRRIVTLSADGTARVWSASTGRVIVEFKGGRGHVQGAGFSLDGRYVIIASSDNTAGVWRADSSRLLTELQGHSKDVLSATFSPDGQRIVTASSDHTARIWEADDGRLLTEFKGHKDVVTSAVFSPDGRRVVTVSRDNTAAVWEADGGRGLAEFKGHRDTITSAVFSPDGRRIITVSSDNTAHVWDAYDGTFVREFSGGRSHLPEISSDGRRIITLNEYMMPLIWNVDNGKLISEFKWGGHIVEKMEVSRDGRRIAIMSSDQPMQVWDADSGKLVVTFNGDGTNIWDATFSHDGARIVTSVNEYTRIWQTDSGKILGQLQGNRKNFNHMIFSPDGRRLVTIDHSSAVRVWEAESGRLLAELKGHDGALNGVSFSPDGQRIVTASSDHTARVWDLSSETRTNEQLAKLMRCHVPVRFEREGSSIISFRKPTPEECQERTLHTH